MTDENIGDQLENMLDALGDEGADMPQAKRKKTAQLEKLQCDYDKDAINDFLDMVFHSLDPDAEDDNVLIWRTSNAPAYPIGEDKLDKALNTKVGLSWYVGTATMRKGELDGKPRLLNRQSLFNAMHFLVLDDIGTKIPVDAIPEAMKPTYIIESSKGNYQYGYVFDEPIEDIKIAEAVLFHVYTSGLTDEGGRMPNKLVRLPCGVNVKEGEKRGFPVRLVETDGPLWSPRSLLHTIDPHIDWDSIVADAADAMKRRALSRGNAGAFAQLEPLAPTLNGVVDPVLEWLYSKNMVYQETDTWVTIKCPWHQSHTNGDSTAGYSPLGRGEGVNRQRRAFHCFHDHCSNHKTEEFLNVIADDEFQGPRAAAFDPIGLTMQRHVYDSSSDRVFTLGSRGQVLATRRIAGFRNAMMCNKVRIRDEKTGKSKSHNPVDLWLHSHSRCEVVERVIDTTSTERIIEQEDVKVLNAFNPPQHDYIKPDVEGVLAPWFDYIEYLIPDKDDREFFLNHTASKVQDRRFRGCGILMVTPTFGVGRSTLAGILAELFGSDNIDNRKFSELMNPSDFNPWERFLYVVCHEVHTIDSMRSLKNSSERLKDLIDPAPRSIVINEKYAVPFRVVSTTSYLMFSNHEDAIYLPEGDRRVYVMNNARVRRSPEYFIKLNAWLDKGEWVQHLWSWFLDRDVSDFQGHAPAVVNMAKKAMAYQARSLSDIALDTLYDLWPAKVVSTTFVKDVMDMIGCEELGLNTQSSLRGVVNHSFKQRLIRGEFAVRPRDNVGFGKPSLYPITKKLNEVEQDIASRRINQGSSFLLDDEKQQFHRWNDEAKDAFLTLPEDYERREGHTGDVSYGEVVQAYADTIIEKAF